MTWIKHPTKIDNLWSITDLWIGNGTDSGLFLYKIALGGNDPRYVISSAIGYSLEVDSETLAPVMTDCGGKYAFAGQSRTIWFNGSQWILMTAQVFPGYVPSAWYNNEIDQMEGDAWWTAYSLPEPGDTVTFSAQGTASGTKTVSAIMPRWERTANEWGLTPINMDTPLGTYTDPAGIQSAKTVGTPTWEGDDGEWYPRSLTKSSGKFAYGGCKYSSGRSKWVIGTVGSPGGWYEGPEPSRNDATFYEFKTNTIPNTTKKLHQWLTHDYNSQWTAVTYDDGTATVFVPDVEDDLGWLESTASIWSQNITFHSTEWPEDETTYKPRQLLTKNLKWQNGKMTIVGTEWESNDAAFTTDVAFTANYAEIEGITLEYHSLQMGSADPQNIRLSEVAIWRQ